MPELPDIAVYLRKLEPRILDRRLERIHLASPFLLRTVSPAPEELTGRRVTELDRIGKRIVIGVEGELFAVLHLMIAGRLHWKKPGARPPGRVGAAAFGFEGGTLVLTEAASRKRAALHLVAGREALAALDPGGVEPLEITEAEFAAAIARGNHTLKRALTDPHLLAGIGNAYSDEILHAARLSPFQRAGGLSPEATHRLFEATRRVIVEWTERLDREAGAGFPEGVTAFREGMTVHGRYGHPCARCGTAIQRIRYADNESNYCPRCQTGGRMLSDRSLARLLHGDWPKTIDELESRTEKAASDRVH